MSDLLGCQHARHAILQPCSQSRRPRDRSDRFSRAGNDQHTDREGDGAASDHDPEGVERRGEPAGWIAGGWSREPQRELVRNGRARTRSTKAARSAVSTDAMSEHPGESGERWGSMSSATNCEEEGDSFVGPTGKLRAPGTPSARRRTDDQRVLNNRRNRGLRAPEHAVRSCTSYRCGAQTPRWAF